MKSLLKKIISEILILESRIILKKYKPFIITVTGTVGKTSTKDAIYTALSSTKDYVRKSEKSFNSELGVPLTILGCENGWMNPFHWLSNIFEGIELIIFKSDYPKCLVLEIGADHPGDIARVAKWLRSDVVVITKISDIPVHVEFFSSPGEVVLEKAELLKTLKKDATLVLLADDKKVANLSNGVNRNILTFGINEMATVTAQDITVFYEDGMPAGMSFKINFRGESVNMKIHGILGVQQIYPIIASIAVGSVFYITLPRIVDSFEHHVPPRGRMNVIKGINKSIIIDDTYNSSPDAIYEGLNTLVSLQVSGRRIAVLGDMMELGTFSTDEHRKAGIQAMQSSDILVTVGQRAKLMSDKSVNFSTASEAGEYVKNIVGEGDVVFIKGSQSVRMERITKALMEEPEKARELLVRQEEEWLARS